MSIPTAAAAAKTAGIAAARSLSTSAAAAAAARRPRRRPTGVRRGFLPRGQRPEAAAVRVKAKQQAVVSVIPKLPKPPTAIVPKRLQPLPPRSPVSAASNAASKGGGGGGGSSSSSNVASKTGTHGGGAGGAGGGGANNGSSTNNNRWKEWFRQNTPVLILNFGSLCTLTGFTRQDVLELRALSMTGSISSVLYFSFSRPMPWAAMGWSSIFAMTNAYNIYKILDERGHRVVMTDEEEELFVEHFMPHGLTPKQFKKVMAKAERVTVSKGNAISKQGAPLDSVYLVMRGDTRGSAFGRRISAASSVTGNRNALRGGDTGAWIGEIEFLELLWQKEHPPKKAKAAATVATHDDGEKAELSNGDVEHSSVKKMNGKEAGGALITSVKEVVVGAAVTKDAKGGAAAPGKEQADNSTTASSLSTAAAQHAVERPSNAGRALYTTIAEEECELARFSHSDLEDLMKSSSDMRSAMTRAMTAVVVGRVVNFTVSRSTGSPTWSTWLDEWKHSGGAMVNVRSQKIVDAIKSAPHG